MPKAKILPPARFLRKCLRYNKRTGVLTWRQRPRSHFATVQAWHRFNIHFAGKQAGTLQGGYRTVCFNGKPHQVARVIWKLVTGKEPRATIDHRNRRKLDNRWANLREATLSQQQKNRGIIRSNTSGICGVDWFQNRWRAQTMVNGIRMHLGRFRSRREAIAAWKAAQPVIR